jgi:hypothetical protein
MVHHDGLLTVKQRSRLLTVFGVSALRCDRCDRKIVVPDPTDSRGKGRKIIPGRIWHGKCWAKLFYDLSSE